MNTFYIYIIFMLDNFIWVFWFLMALFLFYLLGSAYFHKNNSVRHLSSAEERDFWQKWITRTKIKSLYIIPLLFMVTLVPDTKTAMSIFAVDTVINNKQIKGISSDALNLLEKKIKDELVSDDKDISEK